MNRHIDKAMQLRNETPMVSNCAQTIMRAYADELGMTEQQAAAIGCNFGGGMKCGGTCGAITSALMVVGAKGIDSPAVITEFRKRIAATHNARKGGVKKEHCDNMIKESIELIDEITNKED